VTDYIFSIVLLIIALVAIELRKIYHALPKNEVRFRARHGDQLANKIYHAVAYEESLEILLWTIILLSVSGSLLLLNSVAPSWLNFIAVALYLGIAFAWLPRVKYNSISDKLALYLTPAIVWVLNYLHPVIQKVYRLVNRKGRKHSHTGIYDEEGLNELLEKQKTQADSRISKADLELVTKSLDLANKKIGDYQRSWSDVKKVKADDSIGPVLLDELHKSEQHFAPVLDESKEVIGVLNVSKLDISSGGEVKKHMDHHIHYLEEDQSLKDALLTITKANQLVYIVKDSRDNNIGMITLADILNELLVEHEVEEEEIIQDVEDPELEQINETEDSGLAEEGKIEDPDSVEDNEPEVV